MFDDKTREAMRTNLEGFGDAFAGRGVSINDAIVALRPLLRDVVPVARNLSDPDTQLKRFVSTLGATAAIVAPAAETQAELFVNLDTTFGALREVARPVHPGLDHPRAPGARRRRSASFPVQRPFLLNTEGLFRELRPGVRALRTLGADPRRRARGRHADAAAQRRAQPAPRAAAARAAGLRQRPAGAARHRRADRHVRTLNPTLQYLAPGPAAVQLRDAVVPQRLLAAQRGRHERHLAALHHHRHAAGAQQRGRPGRRRPPTARRPTTTCTPTRTRTPRRRASRRSARRPTSPTRAARP